MGGAYQTLLLEGAVGATLGFLIFFGALAWSSSRHLVDGSVLAMRMRERLPGLGAILGSAVLWYVAAESLEPAHAGVTPLAGVVALVAAAWLVQHVARAIADGFARAVIAVTRSSFCPRAPAWQRRTYRVPVARQPLLARRRFARPPPIAA